VPCHYGEPRDDEKPKVNLEGGDECPLVVDESPHCAVERHCHRKGPATFALHHDETVDPNKDGPDHGDLIPHLCPVLQRTVKRDAAEPDQHPGETWR